MIYTPGVYDIRRHISLNLIIYLKMHRQKDEAPKSNYEKLLSGQFNNYLNIHPKMRQPVTAVPNSILYLLFPLQSYYCHYHC